MKDYKRLTKWVINKFSQKPEAHLKDKHSEPIVPITRLAELEDKIEAGELISTVQDEQSEQEIAFFAKHDVKVCKEVVKECLQVLRDMRVVLGIYDDYLLGWNDGINEAIDRLAKKYCIDEEVFEE